MYTCATIPVAATCTIVLFYISFLSHLVDALELQLRTHNLILEAIHIRSNLFCCDVQSDLL